MTTFDPDANVDLDAPLEHPLRGGRISRPVRVGDTVRRPSRPWSSGTQALLSHLADTGFTQTPRYLGRGEQGRDVLTYLPGDTLGEPDTWPAWVWSEDLLTDIGRWLRRLHDTTRHWQPPETATWFTGHTWSPGLIIGHHDAAPWNAVVHDGPPHRLRRLGHRRAPRIQNSTSPGPHSPGYHC